MNLAPSGQSVMDRVRDALKADSLDGVADALGEKRSTVGSWSARGSVPLEGLIKVARIARCSLDYLVLGEESQNAIRGETGAGLYVTESPAPWAVAPVPNEHHPTSGDGASPTRHAALPAGLLQARGAGAVLPLVLSLPLGEQGGRTKEYQVLPTYVRFASAGPGASTAATADQVNLAGDIAFSFEWMRQNLGHTSGRLSAIQVRGDSMASTLLDGETIIIDEGVQGVEVDGIYVFDYHTRRFVKRLQQLTDGTLIISSDNPNYQKETVPRDRARDVRVIGRMVWPRTR